MSAFGPFYPPALQHAINHAERFSDILARLPVAAAEDAETAWIVGRVDEIACFVRAITRDWRGGGIEECRAAVAIGMYVDGLHAGLVRRLGVGTLACCAVLDVTARPLTCDASTLVAPVLWSRRLRASVRSWPRSTRSRGDLDYGCSGGGILPRTPPSSSRMRFRTIA
jgi:hypothetical protein